MIQSHFPSCQNLGCCKTTGGRDYYVMGKFPVEKSMFFKVSADGGLNWGIIKQGTNATEWS